MIVLPVNEYRKKHELTVLGHGGAIPDPYQTFESTGFNKKILKVFELKKFAAPSPIQAQTWSISGDLLGIAKTGSGKTLAYLLPLFHRLLDGDFSVPSIAKCPKVLVLAPTRELAIQISEEALHFGRVLGIKCVAIYGGASKGPQISSLNAGVHVVIGTPGRVSDLQNMVGWDKKPILLLNQVEWLVLDEADRMLDMGFEPAIREICKALPKHGISFFTATWNKTVQNVAADLLGRAFVEVKIGGNEELVANKDVTQELIFCTANDKRDKLTPLLAPVVEKTETKKIIIFCNKKISVQGLADELWGSGLKCDAIHGDKGQAEREYILKEFKSGRLDILIASDVAARGLDIKGVDLVINYDMPQDYVHRIGRTGRAGVKGVAVTLFDVAEDRPHAKDLAKIMKEAGFAIPEKLDEMIPKARGWGNSGGRGGRGRGGGGYRGYSGGYGGGRQGGYGRSW